MTTTEERSTERGKGSSNSVCLAIITNVNDLAPIQQKSLIHAYFTCLNAKTNTERQ
jgi:hypothetical protein